MRRAEPSLAPPRPDRVAPGAFKPGWTAIKQRCDAEQGGKQCDAPRNSGWRPGAKWARGSSEAEGATWAGETRRDVARRIAALPAHQRPPMREMGRRSEAADHPYKRLPGDDGTKAGDWPEPAGVPIPSRAAKQHRPGSNDPGAAMKEVAAFLDTGRSTAATVARVHPPDHVPPAPPQDGASPLVTVQKTGSRIEVAAASPAARALGIIPGMALTQVRAATPEVIVRDADPDGDARALRRLAILLARRWTPVVAIADAQSLFLDISGVAHLHGGEHAMARRIVRLLARGGITARIGIADTTGAAWACAHHALPDTDGVALLPGGDTIDAIAPLPAEALRIDARALELLRRLGVETVAEVVAMPRAPLVRRFGAAFVTRIDQASGQVAEPLDPIIPPVAITVEQRFAEPLLTAEPIAYWIGQLVQRLADELAKAGRGARTLVLAAARIDTHVQTIRIGLARATRTPDHLLRLLVRRIDRLDPGFGIEALTLHVQRADPLGAEAFDGDLAEGERPDLAPLVDAIVNRIGTRRLWRARAIDSDVPERSVGGAAPLDPPERAAPSWRRDDVRRLDQRGQDHPWHPRWPRPARLLRRPEPVDNVMAGFPDQPPRRFTWRGVTHRIVRGDGPERITGEWWRRSGERDAIRDYYQVEDEDGRRFWLFRRGDGERAATGDLSWYVHGTFG